MGKRKEKDKVKEQDDSSAKKKAKKHKKHKKKRERSLNSDNEEIDVVNDDLGKEDGTKGLIKLKIKFSGKTLSSTELVSDSGKDDNTTDDYDDSQEEGSAARSSKSGSKVAADDEECWLDALEKGELDDTGGIKRKEKDVSLMTARQRALRGEKSSTADDLMQLPMYPEKSIEETEEEERRKKQRAKKRKQQLQKQVEETKSQTIEKLLTKGQKTKKPTLKNQQSTIISGPHFRYQNNQNGIMLSCSEEVDYPFGKCVAKSPPGEIKCSVDGCHNIKKYNHSKINVPICSLQCYKVITQNNVAIST